MVLNSKKNQYKKVPSVNAYLSPASSGNSIKFKMGSQESRGNVASNSTNRKNLISKPIVPPHLKYTTSLKHYSSISANISPKESNINLAKKNKIVFKKPQKIQVGTSPTNMKIFAKKPANTVKNSVCNTPMNKSPAQAMSLRTSVDV